MSLDTLEAGTYTNRHDSPLEPSLPQQPESPPTNALPESPPPVPEPAKEPTARETNLIDDLSKQFAKTIGDQATQEQPTPEPAPQPPPEKTWRDAEPPPNVTKKVAEDWRSFRSKANAEIEERNSRIKSLESELASFRDNAPKAEQERESLKKQLSDSLGIVEKVAIERSPLFKSKVLDAEEALKGRMAKMLEGTNLNGTDGNHLLSGTLSTREQILERANLSSFRRTQIAEIINKWDQIAEDRDKMLNRGRETLQEFIKENEETQQRNRAEYMRSSARTYEDESALIMPKLEPYAHIDGNEDWNRGVTELKNLSRKIYDGQVDRQTLARASILAPAAIVYQKLYQMAMAQNADLKTQVTKLQGLSPGVRDSGGDLASPGSPPRSLSSPNGDFVKELVQRFQKDTGLS